MTMRFAPLAHLRSTQPTSHLQAYSAAGGKALLGVDEVVTRLV
jgi:hypothetical protein